MKMVVVVVVGDVDSIGWNKGRLMGKMVYVQNHRVCLVCAAFRSPERRSL